MQTPFIRSHHQLVQQALQQFNVAYLSRHQILFGGGTRIALELNEFRQSVDIDFLCPNAESYRAVRSTVSSGSLGKLVHAEFSYPRDIRSDRDAVRCFILIDNVAIKLEFVACADYQLQPAFQQPFGVPMLDHTSCFVTKLLANADRYHDKPYKDIFDLLAMTQAWGKIPIPAWEICDAIYGEKVVKTGLINALKNIENNLDKYMAIATNELLIEPNFANDLLKHIPQYLAQQL